MFTTRDLTGATIRGGQVMATWSTMRAATVWELGGAPGAGAWRNYGAALARGCSRTAATMRAPYSRAQRAERGALVTYACGASTIWETACECRIAIRGDVSKMVRRNKGQKGKYRCDSNIDSDIDISLLFP
eukprot:6214658-Pleurochrysis_carterae.AAC.3